MNDHLVIRWQKCASCIFIDVLNKLNGRPGGESSNRGREDSDDDEGSQLLPLRLNSVGREVEAGIPSRRALMFMESITMTPSILAQAQRW